MKRMTINVSDALDVRLRREADRRGITVSEVTRDALEWYLARGQPRLSFTASGHSGQHDISKHIEQILEEEFGRYRAGLPHRSR